MWIFAALVIIPVVEIALFIELGGWIGLWPTIALIIGTAILGGVLLRAQGFAALRQMQEALDKGGDPRGPLASGLLIVIAGVLMLTPGFLTDAVGFALLIPPLRAALIAWAGPRMAARMVRVRSQGAARRGADPTDAPIEAEYVDLDAAGEEERPAGRRPASRWTRPPN